MWVIGIVGGIASGKSLVSNQLRELGAHGIDADRLGHDVLREPAIRDALVGRWGAGILGSDGEIDRRRVAERVFAPGPEGDAARAYLEALVHPRIEARIEQDLARIQRDFPEAVVVLDAALLVEKGWNRWCDAVVFVDAEEAVRKQRALDRGWSEAQWRARESAQTDLQKKREVADYTLDNSLSTAETYRQVRELWARFQFTSRLPNT